MIDLIDECSYDFLKMGYKKKKADKYGIELLSLHVKSKEQSKKLGFDKGDYFIINVPLFNYLKDSLIDYLSTLLSKRIKYLIKKYNLHKKKTLIVGLGNPEIWADRLGIETCNNFNICEFQNIMKICPNVYFETGVKTFDIVNALVKNLNIEFVILIDSLCTNNLSRLGCSLQLTTTGMTPGSAVNSKSKRICEKELNIPCFSLGVPFMFNAKDLNNFCKTDLLLCPKDIKENILDISLVLSKALQEALIWTIIFLYHSALF